MLLDGAMLIGALDRQVTIEHKVSTPDPDYGTEVITWTKLATVWANVQDALPSTAESVVQGLAVSKRQTRIRMRYRTDIDSSMRVIVHGPVDRLMQIVGGPAEIGQRLEGIEIMCEQFSS